MNNILSNIPRYLTSPNIFDEKKVDIIVIGGGIAGLTAALECSKDKEVLLVMENDFKDCSTYLAQGGIAASTVDIDSPLKHFNDTTKAGNFLNDQNNLKILTTEAPKAIEYLIENGVNFDKDENGFCLAREGGHGLRRILRIDGDSTGKGLINTLKQKVLKANNIKVMKNSFMVDILTNKSCVQGITLKTNSKLCIIYSKALILASGGVGAIYENTTNPSHNTGDGIAAAFRAGAEITDLEFIQFHPTVFYYPEASGFLISEAVRGEKALLRNSKGEKFMAKYHQDAELAPRDIVARAIFSEMKRLNTTNVYLDITHHSRDFLQKRFPQIFSNCLKCGIDIAKDWIPVAPSVHYTMGGIKTNSYGETNIKGLYAIGEVACTGVHGANRLASNSLLEGIVFGRRASKKAIKYCLERNFISDNQMIKFRPVKSRKYDEFLIKTQISELRQQNLKLMGLIRSEKSFLDLSESLTKNPLLFTTGFNDKEVWKFQNMLLISYLVALAALNRKESIGAHYRSDYPLTTEKKIHYIFKLEGIKEVVA